jgi:hypothetical protein
MDFANQIQLGSKGQLDSISVPYVRNDGTQEKIDFFEALKRIQSEARKEEQAGRELDWKKYKNTLSAGLRHYLVRSTRQGVEAEGGIISADGTSIEFPKSTVRQIEYQYDNEDIMKVVSTVDNNIQDVFEGIEPRYINLDVASNLTQVSEHPLDIFAAAKSDSDNREAQYESAEEIGLTLFMAEPVASVIPNIFQIINLIGFAPYRPDLYMHSYHGKTIEDINTLLAAEQSKVAQRRTIKIQMAIHNMLHVTWLKRLESSAAALLKSVQYYQRRIELFERYLNRGYILSLSDISLLQNEYEEDVELAFADYDKYIKDVQDALDSGAWSEEIKKQGIERKEADPKVYDIDALKRDILRDKRICELLVGVLDDLKDPQSNGKLRQLAGYIEKVIKEGKYGRKIVVFSFFADTINYLSESLPAIITGIPDFNNRAAFITGGSGAHVEDAARRFSPVSKKYPLKETETELDFLFATDVLSEGQNLQDAGILINYDLHWNPVRMIQRNGRINRLGSTYKEVLIANTMPSDELELYLRLVRRLERKITTIKNAIGIDQGVLDDEINPIQFIDEFPDAATKIYSTNPDEASKALEELEDEEDVLSWTDDYSFELRRFIKDHEGDGEVERIRAIPPGKWNYLPEKNAKKPADNACLALERLTGRTSLTGEPINDTMFITVTEDGRYGRAHYIEDEEALSYIKTAPDDNGCSRDTIEADRSMVARRASRQARTRGEAPAVSYPLKPSHKKALDAIQDHFLISTSAVVEKGMRNALQKKTFESLVRQVNREVKESGSPYASTISKFESLIKDLQKTAAEDREIDEVVNVLFYAARSL